MKVQPEFLSTTALARLIGVSPRTLHRLMRSDKDFPRPFKLNARNFLHSRREIFAFMDSKRHASKSDARDDQMQPTE